MGKKAHLVHWGWKEAVKKQIGRAWCLMKRSYSSKTYNPALKLKYFMEMVQAKHPDLKPTLFTRLHSWLDHINPKPNLLEWFDS